MLFGWFHCKGIGLNSEKPVHPIGTDVMFCFMNDQHDLLLSRLKLLPTKSASKQFGADYTGSARKAYFVSSPDMRKLIKDWLQESRQLTAEEVFHVTASLMAGESHEERKMAAKTQSKPREDANEIIHF